MKHFELRSLAWARNHCSQNKTPGNDIELESWLCDPSPGSASARFQFWVMFFNRRIKEKEKRLQGFTGAAGESFHCHEGAFMYTEPLQMVEYTPAEAVQLQCLCHP